MFFDHIEEKEAVKTAAIIEANGYKFYTLLSGKTENKGVKAVLKKLADDEKRHLKTLEEKFFPGAGFSDLITEEELAIEDYLEKSGRGDIFSRRVDIERLVKALDTPRKALILALDTERHSVEFFESLSKRSSTDEGRQTYRRLLEEERSHVEQIEGLLSASSI